MPLAVTSGQPHVHADRQHSPEKGTQQDSSWHSPTHTFSLHPLRCWVPPNTISPSQPLVSSTATSLRWWLCGFHLCCPLPGVQEHGLIPVSGSILNPFPSSSPKELLFGLSSPSSPVHLQPFSLAPSRLSPSLLGQGRAGAAGPASSGPGPCMGAGPQSCTKSQCVTQWQRSIVLPHPCPPSSPLAPQLLQPLRITVRHQSGDGWALYYR